MKDSKEILSSILKTTQMGQIGIRAVQDKAVRTEMKQALSDQLKEYDTIESQAHAVAEERGWKVEELDPGVRKMAELMTKTRLQGRNKDSKIAAMMMKGIAPGANRSFAAEEYDFIDKKQIDQFCDLVK